MNEKKYYSYIEVAIEIIKVQQKFCSKLAEMVEKLDKENQDLKKETSEHVL